MASTTIKKIPFFNIYQTQVALPTPVTIPSGQLSSVLNNTDIKTLTVTALDTVPQDKTIKYAVYLWSSGSNCCGVSSLVQNGLVSVTLLNLTSAAQTISAVRLLVFTD